MEQEFKEFDTDFSKFKNSKMMKMTNEEMEDYVMLEEMRASKNEPTVTYEEFLKIVGWKRISYKNQSKSNASVNHLRK